MLIWLTNKMNPPSPHLSGVKTGDVVLHRYYVLPCLHAWLFRKSWKFAQWNYIWSHMENLNLNWSFAHDSEINICHKSYGCRLRFRNTLLFDWKSQLLMLWTYLCNLRDFRAVGAAFPLTSSFANNIFCIITTLATRGCHLHTLHTLHTFGS